LSALEADAGIHGVVFSSGLQRDVFTAGNDITELYMPATSGVKFTTFWTAQTRFLTRLYKSPLVAIAAIRGACPARALPRRTSRWTRRTSRPTA